MLGEDGFSLAEHERAALDGLRSLLASPVVWEDPPPGLEDAVVAAITSQAAAPPRPAPVRWLGIPAGLDSYRLPTLGCAVAAVLAALAIVLGTGGTGPEPLRFAMSVSGTRLAPGAHGEATLTKTPSGWKVKLTVTGLPHLAGRRYYEGWLENPALTLVPIGTFNDAREVTLWAGVPATRFRTLTVTIQHVGGSPASSGVRVLTGAIRR
jgi:hypothetical protein